MNCGVPLATPQPGAEIFDEQRLAGIGVRELESGVALIVSTRDFKAPKVSVVGLQWYGARSAAVSVASQENSGGTASCSET